MSEQTPEAALDASEPSMEDILASIRKIIADDDGAVPSAREAAALTDSEDGSVEQIDSTTIDPGIEHFVSDTESVADTASDLATSDIDDVEDVMDSLTSDLAADLPSDLESDLTIEDAPSAMVDLEIEEPVSTAADIEFEDLDLTVTDTATEDAGIMDFDLEEELSGLADLEIPTPDPAEATTDSGAGIVATATGLAAAGAGVLGAMSGKTDLPNEMVAVDDIDDDLSALLEESLTVDDDTQEIAQLNDAVDAVDAVDAATPNEIELTDADAIDAELASLLDDSAVEDEAPEALIEEEVFDVNSDANDELESLIEDIDTEIETAELDANELDAAELDAGATSEDDPDLLLVKSLMADLADYNTTEGSLDADLENVDEDELEALDDEGDDLEALLETVEDTAEAPLETPTIDVDDTASADIISDIPDDIDEEDSALLDELLDMSDEDDLEIAAALDAPAPLQNADDVAALELENIAENQSMIQQADVQEPAASMSLSDIAAAAQADADANAIGLGAVLAGAGAAAVGTAAVVSGQDADDALSLTQFDENDVVTDEDVDEMLKRLLDEDAEDADIVKTDIEASGITEPEQIEPAITTPEPAIELETTQETTDMPRAAAKKKDVIMDEVEGAATASVFAQLNQVVEEKAVSAERGDRVGDLVMELLQPMLKEWLDKNLKGIVERAVTKEVKRISSGK